MWYKKVCDWMLNKIKQNKQVKRDNSDSTTASNIFKCSSTEVTLSNSTKVLISNDDFRYTYETTKFREQDQDITVENYTCTTSSHTLREPLLQDI